MRGNTAYAFFNFRVFCVVRVQDIFHTPCTIKTHFPYTKCTVDLKYYLHYNLLYNDFFIHLDFRCPVY